MQLLAPEVRHERNVVLQCVRFIVRSGFLGLAAKDSGEIGVSVNTSDEEKRSESVFQQLVCDEHHTWTGDSSQTHS